MRTTTPQLDWTNLPPGAETVGLWQSLHDANLCSIQSNLLDRTIRLEFSIDYLCEFHSLPGQVRFHLLLSGVSSTRILRWEPWPGQHSIPEGCNYEERERIVAEYWAKAREESASWIEFESARYDGPSGGPQVSNATLLVGNQQVALKLEVIREHDYHELTIRAESLAISRSDGASLTLTDFQQLGEAYWDNFARKSKACEF